ncbi:MAG: YesL family protein [Oscillospiraceae bacterium]|nr:YesL family protein [Oscillospiraceae bacterium]
MGLFYNNNVAGSGVAKRRRKKPFFRFWELFWGKFWNMFTMNLIYVLACIPIVTIGPATAALTAMMRNVYLERPQFIWHDFWREFKKNFKKSFVIGIIDVAAIALLLLTYNLFANTEDQNTRIICVLAFAAQAVFLLMNFYIYPQIAALEMKMSDILRNSLILVFVNLPAELIVIAALVGFVSLLVFFFFPAVFFLPFMPGAWMIFLSVFCCYPAIQKLIINPYYEQSGEPNPEIPAWELEEEENGEAVFADQGGSEEPIDLREEKKKGRKIIK